MRTLADGTIKILTDLDASGFQKGLSKLGSVAILRFAYQPKPRSEWMGEETAVVLVRLNARVVDPLL